jgi:DNA-binding MarR family transcriptional regulator
MWENGRMAGHAEAAEAGAPAWLDAVEMRAWRALLGAHSRLARSLDEELQAAHGISLLDHEVLIHLSEAPRGRLRMADLANRVVMSRSGLTRRVDRLVAAGLTRRIPCASDGRGVWAELTPSGRAQLEAGSMTHVEGVRAHFVAKLTRAQLAQLAEALEPVAGATP